MRATPGVRAADIAGSAASIKGTVVSFLKSADSNACSHPRSLHVGGEIEHRLGAGRYADVLHDGDRLGREVAAAGAVGCCLRRSVR